jgi:hypothetical protein
MPTSIRAVGVSACYMTQHIMIIVLVQCTPTAIESISWRYFLIFVCGSAIFAVAFYFFYPETRYKTLEEIEAMIGDKVSFLPTNSSIHAILCSFLMPQLLGC